MILATWMAASAATPARLREPAALCFMACAISTVACAPSLRPQGWLRRRSRVDLNLDGEPALPPVTLSVAENVDSRWPRLRSRAGGQTRRSIKVAEGGTVDC